MPLRVAEKDGFIFAVNKCDECPSCFRMLSGVKAHLSDNKPSGFGCFHDDITTRKEIGKEIKLNCIPVWCPLPRDEGDGKITVTGDRIKPLFKKRSASSLDREYR